LLGKALVVRHVVATRSITVGCGIVPQGAHGAELQEVLTVDLKAELADGAA